MAGMTTTVLLEDLAFPEGPRWRDGRLWFSDMHSGLVRTVDLDGHAEDVATVPEAPSGLGWLPDGTLLVVSMHDRRVLRVEEGTLVEHADLSDVAGWHCNDMLVDDLGRAYVGNFGFDVHSGAAPASTSLALVGPDGSVRTVAGDLHFPNGIVRSPDGNTLVVAETMAARLTAFDVAQDGSLSGRREFAALGSSLPDGICIDAEGAVWAACIGPGHVARVTEGGEITEVVEVQRASAYACMLGGDDGRTLFVCTSDHLTPDECREHRSGAIEVVDVAVPHAGLP